MTLTWLISIDFCLASVDHDENLKTGSFQPTLWLSSAVEVTYTVGERHSVGRELN